MKPIFNLPEHPYFIDERIIPPLRTYIKSQLWDLVDDELDKILSATKHELHKWGGSYAVIADQCNSSDDAHHTKEFADQYIEGPALIDLFIVVYDLQEWLPCNQCKNSEELRTHRYEIYPNDRPCRSCTEKKNICGQEQRDLLAAVDEIQGKMKEVLLFLSIPMTELGRQRQKLMKRFAKVRGTDQTLEREQVWTEWRAEAEKLREKHPTFSKRSIAELIKKNLSLPDSTETIRKKI